jgi:hypothetical protein
VQDHRQPVIVEGVDVAQVVQFPRLWQAVGMSFAPPRLAIGLMMTAAMMSFGAIWDAASAPIAGTDAGSDSQGPFAWTVSQVVAHFNQVIASTIALDGAGVAAALRGWLAVPAAMWDRAPAFVIVFGLVKLVVVAVGGGALARMAACEFASGERLRVVDGLQFAVSNIGRLIMAPTLPLLVAGILALVLMAAGWVMRLPLLNLVGGPLYGVALIVGFIIAFLAIGYAAGSIMLIPAVACESCDAGDALQRSYAYVLSRPVHLIGYALTALAGLAAGFLVMSLFAVTTLNVTAAAVGAWGDAAVLQGAGGYGLFDFGDGASGAAELAWHESWARGWVGLWETLIVGLVVAYVIAYVQSASTVIYLLMRRACDGQETTEIWQPGLAPGSYLTAVPGSPSASPAVERPSAP